MYKPGDTYWCVFATFRNDTGAQADATGTPAATMYKNGTADGAVTITVTKISTGLYKATCTIPGTYAAGDKIAVGVAATVNAVAQGFVISNDVLDGKRVADLNDLSSANVQSAILDSDLSSFNSVGTLGAAEQTAQQHYKEANATVVKTNN